MFYGNCFDRLVHFFPDILDNLTLHINNIHFLKTGICFANKPLRAEKDMQDAAPRLTFTLRDEGG